MKTLVAVMLFAVYGLAQQSSTPPQFHEACGPLKVNFETSISTNRPPAQPEPGKALVYVAEDYPPIIGAPTFKIGLDGAWMGATHGGSYLVFSVDPGEHHMCIRWQSRLDSLSRMVSFAHLTAEPGKTYYFRARAIYYPPSPMYLDLDLIDPDEGQYMVASSPLITAHAKK
ncbi:MAG: hypothetical protein WCF26_08850 [Candidatus Sulfotelmatobacter sp.]